MSTTAIRPASASALMGMHRVVIEIDHAWRPMDIVAGSGDNRTLGLQIGDVQLK